MINTKLLKILPTLSRKELKEFEIFLKTFYSKQSLSIRLLDYLTQFYPSFLNEEKLNVEIIYFEIFNLPMLNTADRKKLLNSFSDLIKFVLEYLTWKEIKNDSYEKQILQLRILKKRRLRSEYFNKIKTVGKKIRNQKIHDPEFYFKQMQLGMLEYYSQNEDKFSVKKNEAKNIMTNLDLFYISQKLKIGCELLSRKYLLKEEYDILFFKEIKLLQDQRDEKKSFAGLYLEATRLITAGEKKSIHFLKNELINSKSIRKEDQFILLVYLINFAADKIREGETQYLNEAFKLYKIGLDSDLFILDGYFPSKTFQNIVNTGSGLNKYSWTKKFIKNWSGYLNPKDQFYIKKISEGRVAFAQKEYGLAIEILNKIKTKKIAYNLVVRILLIRCFFEENYSSEFLIHYSKNFVKSLNRNKTLDKPIIDASLNFLFFFNSLVEKTSKAELVSLWKSNSSMYCRDWVKSKIDELPNK